MVGAKPRTWGGLLTLSLLIIALMSIAPTVSQADNGDLQRALLDAACANAKVTRLAGVGKKRSLQGSLLGTSHKRIKMVYIAGRCIADRPPANQANAEEQH